MIGTNDSKLGYKKGIHYLFTCVPVNKCSVNEHSKAHPKHFKPVPQLPACKYVHIGQMSLTLSFNTYPDVFRIQARPHFFSC